VPVLHNSFGEQLAKPDNDHLAAIALTAATNRYPELTSNDLELQSVQYKYEPTNTHRPVYFGVTLIISSTKTNEETETETIMKCEEVAVLILPDGKILDRHVSRNESEQRYSKLTLEKSGSRIQSKEIK